MLISDRHPPARAQQTVVGLPAQIDIANSGRIRDKLAASGVTTVIADLSRTALCDGEGACSLAQAHRQLAADYGVELRLAVPSAAVRGVLAMLAVDGQVVIYLSLEAALAPGPAPLGSSARSPALEG